jgi:hypothetical protein
MNLQENIQRIKEMMGLITEGSKWKPCKKCIGTYGSGMVDCAYEAIERFEENYGTAAGTSMGDTYFEGNWKRFDKIILSRINGLVPRAWQSMSEKFKMQLWSFMYNSDSGGEDKFRWLAVLYLTANPEITSFDKKITSNIINKKNPVKWKEAVTLVSKTSSWDYNKFIKMLDGQYSTYGNEGAYKNTWSIRPTALTDMYDECKGGNAPEDKKNSKVEIDKYIPPANVADKTRVEKLKK